ncbi:hypothetical protein PF005_g22849 [Phytophthora fragariae]|uniref:RxLR effector protein n=1 Tax=Phytophthora fragariae TaxID=53985 RepID=A0A6A3WFW2_9STRA|nr:hypothetical protein PF003_g34393 [Phytophthora fragariae]KAE8926175.1 hypothetical protein PF009_g23631 [Phytophthora fragariae]KAE9081125.1 hypothetical protein PF007_g22787 [Phytophthora fragariae]KAE9104320.1 hypothetical protein PF006_g21937 [Phytophthora fragariae]KAE9181537.1 hypothetical protein PF005_g22849 [Phytophthora fragariae]
MPQTWGCLLLCCVGCSSVPTRCSVSPPHTDDLRVTTRRRISRSDPTWLVR